MMDSFTFLDDRDEERFSEIGDMRNTKESQLQYGTMEASFDVILLLLIYIRLRRTFV